MGYSYRLCSNNDSIFSEPCYIKFAHSSTGQFHHPAQVNNYDNKVLELEIPDNIGEDSSRIHQADSSIDNSSTGPHEQIGLPIQVDDPRETKHPSNTE